MLHLATPLSWLARFGTRRGMGKTVHSLRLFQALRMASTLLLGVTTMSGCLLPQEDRLLEETTPVMANRPPRILDEGAQPGRSITIDDNTQCSLTFRANIEDLDTDELGLRTRWFIDWSDSNGTTVKEETVPPTDFAIRARAVSLPINLNSPASPLRTTGTHVVELMVSDGEIAGRETQQSFGPDGGVVNPRYSDFHAWFVTTVSTNCSP
jgi:hypothetical protein